MDFLFPFTGLAWLQVAERSNMNMNQIKYKPSWIERKT